MENKYFKAPHQGPSWSHFRGRAIHKKKLLNSNLQNEIFSLGRRRPKSRRIAILKVVVLI